MTAKYTALLQSFLRKTATVKWLFAYFLLPVFGSAQTPDSLHFARINWKDTALTTSLIWRESRADTLFGARQNLNLIRFRNGPRRMHVAFASAGDSLRKTSWFGQQHGAIAAINGTFFDVKKGGSVDLIRIDGQTLDTTLLDQSGKRTEHRQAALVVHKNKLRIVFGGTAPRWDQDLRERNVMVTGPLLLLNGKPHPLLKNPFNDNRHPRSCVCVTHDRHVIWLTADGRHANAAGLSLPELTRLMQWLGCRDAINLDGGGSTTLWLAGQGENGVVNFPSDGRNWLRTVERPVSNVLILKN